LGEEELEIITAKYEEYKKMHADAKAEILEPQD
jgi:hypothetical protein